MSNRDKEKHKLPEYPLEKIHQIQKYSDDEFICFLQQIAGKPRSDLNSEILDKFVPKHLKAINDNAIKYGEETLKNYIKALKENDDEYVIEHREHRRVKISGIKIWKQFNYVFLLWLICQDDLVESIRDELKLDGFDLETICTVEFLAELCDFSTKSYQISKEKITMFYNFSSILADKELEQDFVANCIEEKYIKIIKDKNQEIERFSQKLKELKSNQETFKSKDEKIEKLENQVNDLLNGIITENIEADILNLIREKEDILEKIANFPSIQKAILEEHEKYFENIYKEFEKTTNERKNAITIEIDELEKEKISLEKDKHSLENEIGKKNVELTNLESSIDQISNRIETNRKDLISDFIVAKTTLEKYFTDSKVVNNHNFIPFEYNLNLNNLPYTNEQSFIDKFRIILYKSNVIKREDFLNPIVWHLAIKSFEKFVFADKRILDCWIKALGLRLPVINTIVEPTWSNVGNWYASYDNKDKELRLSKTQIPDYCYFLKTNPDVFIGFINFVDFNKALTDLYLMPSLKQLQESGNIIISRPREANNNNLEDILSLDSFNKLKLCFIKANSNNVFDISQDLYSYSSVLTKLKTENTINFSVDAEGEAVTKSLWLEWVNNRTRPDENHEIYKLIESIKDLLIDENLALHTKVFDDIETYISYALIYLNDSIAIDTVLSLRLLNAIPDKKRIIQKMIEICPDYCINFKNLLTKKYEGIEL